MIRFRELHEFSERILDYDTRFVRFSSEQVDAGVLRIQLDRLVVLRCDGAFPHFAAESSFRSRAVFVRAAPSGDAIWHGEPVTEHMAASYAAGDDFVGSFRGRVSWAGFVCDENVLEDHARALGHDAERAKVGPLLSLTGEASQQIHAALRRALGVAAFGPHPYRSGPVRAAVEEQILDALAQATHPACEWRSAAAISHERVVRRAFEFLESRPRDAVYVSELCQAAGVSERTLRNAFQDLFGVSPIRYLHLRRMELARREVRASDPRVAQIGDIAHRFGFTNLGRFASEFRQLYGVSPSQMLRGAGR